MSCVEAVDFTKIVIIFRELGEKKLLKNVFKNITSNKKVFLYYSKRGNIPICVLPRLRLILSSRSGFLSFCFNFFSFMSCYSTPITVNHANIQYIANCVISHEIGHILDPDVYQAKEDYAIILTNLIEKLIKYDVNIKDENCHKKNLPPDLEECILDLKKNLISRETKAWDIAETILKFQSEKERYLFYKIKEYALATYNYGNLKTIVKEHNLETFLKYRKYF